MAKKKSIRLSAGLPRSASIQARTLKIGMPPLPLSLKHFPIVGLGASAGGLEALEEFFSNAPVASGIAFVVVTHQPSDHKSLLAELLGRHTRMPVHEAKNGERIAPNHIYLSKPGYCIGLKKGIFRLDLFTEKPGGQLPIDHFFSTLAENEPHPVVGIVLSGTGKDGALGLRSLKSSSGMTMIMAQEPKSAGYSGMPESAIATKLVDYVLRPGQMPPLLLAYAQGSFLKSGEMSERQDEPLSETMEKMVQLLDGRSGNNFTGYKAATIRRRIERRMSIHQLATEKQYLAYLENQPHELDLLFRELLIGVTSFFRDPDAFKSLSKSALIKLLKKKPNNSILRVWLPGCSTGEEAYSISILLRECQQLLKQRITIQIFATDLDEEAIEVARTGVYPGIASSLPVEYLARYFVREDGNYRIKKGIREMVVFALHNVIKDPPFTKLDLLVCRNLLIYLKPEMQRYLFSVFHYALKHGGILFLGPSESTGEFGHYFKVVDKKWKIFTRDGEAFPYTPMRNTHGHANLSFSSSKKSENNLESLPIANSGALFEKLLMKWFVPAAVIINVRGDISYIHGRTGDYLEPAAGHPRLNLLEMAREGLRLELSAAIRRATLREGDVILNNVQIKTGDGFIQAKVTVKQLISPESMRGLILVTFRPNELPLLRKAEKNKKMPVRHQLRHEEELERELEFTKESLQSSIEELQSSNEELQSMNEEMQSTNEELETSREEMQSLNEELQTVNSQLQTKVEALSETNDDMQNLLNSTSIATIFLDMNLKIKRFTEQAKAVIKLIPSDVGRPIGDLVTNLNYDQVAVDAAQVLQNLNFKEREVQTNEGGWRLLRMQPYRTVENRIEGVVLTFLDIDRVKQAEQAAQQARLFAESIVATVRQPLLILNSELRVISANRSFLKFFRLSASAVEGEVIYEIEDGQWNIPQLRTLLDGISKQNVAFEDFKMDFEFPRVGSKSLLLNARRLKQAKTEDDLILLALEETRPIEPLS